MAGFLATSALALSAMKWVAGTDIRFDKGSHKLTLDGMQRLNGVKCFEQAAQLEVAIVVGFAGAKERDPLGLSRKRAEAIAQYLKHRNFDPKRIYVESKGIAAVYPQTVPYSDSNVLLHGAPVVQVEVVGVWRDLSDRDRCRREFPLISFS